MDRKIDKTEFGDALEMEFIKPSEKYLDEYLDACKESHDNNVTEWMPVEPDNFENWKEKALQLYEMLESGEGLPTGIPRMVTYWCIESGKFIGEIQIRPYITVNEAEAIGHIGYAVRYSMWGKGYGTKILQFAVKKLHEHNITPIYIACHVGNAGSNKVSQKVGFEFLDKRETNGEMENLYILR